MSTTVVGSVGDRFSPDRISGWLVRWMNSGVIGPPSGAIGSGSYARDPQACRTIRGGAPAVSLRGSTHASGGFEDRTTMTKRVPRARLNVARRLAATAVVA